MKTRSLWRRCATAVLCLIVLSDIDSRSKAEGNQLPTSEKPVTLVAHGEPLGSALERLSTSSGLTITADRSLASQRVTVVWKDADLSGLCAALKDLLDGGEGAPVLWRKSGTRKWQLFESANRRRLAEQMREAPKEEFRRFLDSEVAWLKSERARDPSPDQNGPAKSDMAQSPDGARRRDAACISAIGQRGIQRLLNGQASVFRVGDIPAPDADDIRSIFRTFGQGQTRPSAIEDCWCALVMGVKPGDAAGYYVMRSLITPEGFTRSRVGCLQMKGQKRSPLVGPPFTVPPVDPADTSPRITVVLPQVTGQLPGTPIWLNFDSMLALTAKTSGKNIVADGYIRPPRQCRSAHEIREYPLKQWLDRISMTWNAEWRQSRTDDALVVRARHWWLEDALDVPQPIVDRFVGSFAPNANGGMDQLLAMAELSSGQVHKLVESGLCPRAGGLVLPGWYDPVSPKACLQFYNRLPGPLQAQVFSPTGLPLRMAPATLVKEWLSPTLAAGAGAVTQEQQDDVIFSVRDLGEGRQSEGRFEVALRSAGRFRTNWSRHIQPSAPAHPTAER